MTRTMKKVVVGSKRTAASRPEPGLLQSLERNAFAHNRRLKRATGTLVPGYRRVLVLALDLGFTPITPERLRIGFFRMSARLTLARYLTCRSARRSRHFGHWQRDLPMN